MAQFCLAVICHNFYYIKSYFIVPSAALLQIVQRRGADFLLLGISYRHARRAKL